MFTLLALLCPLLLAAAIGVGLAVYSSRCMTRATDAAIARLYSDSGIVERMAALEQKVKDLEAERANLLTANQTLRRRAGSVLQGHSA